MSRNQPHPQKSSNSSDFVSQVLSSRKYRSLGIPESTVNDLIWQAQKSGVASKELEKTVRQKMHKLVAPYLGDVNYEAVSAQLDEAFAAHSEEEIRQVCTLILSAHASTKERLSILTEFYAAIFAETGQPGSILDLACGLNPFSIPWMNLSKETRYYAYDIIQPRVDLINHFLQSSQMSPLAEVRDILVDPPTVQADLAFFFKEAHRFDQRQKGCNRAFWISIPAKILLVSLPTSNLAGTHPKLDQHRRLVYDTLEGLAWSVRELLFENEIVFIIRKIP